MPRNPSTRGMNVVPFEPPEAFERFGIDWTQAARSECEQSLREAYLTYESSCGPNGLVSLLLLAVVSRRQGTIAEDLEAAADLAEIVLRMKLLNHQERALEMLHVYVTDGGTLWS